MGANAQTSVPVFTSGQVLTAQQQTEINTGIPVFADSSARDAAFGGTGEKTLAEGQFAYLEDSNTTQYYDGSTWQSVGVTPGLVLVSTTTIGTTVSSVTVSNAFSSTYDNYKIILSGGVASTSNAISMILGATTTGYYRFLIYGAFNSNTINSAGTANAANWENTFVGSTTSLNGVIDLLSPNLAKNTIIVGVNATTTTTGNAFWQNGYLNDTTQYTAFTLTPSAGTLTGGTIKVYGYQNS
jgi:hypothetical protein